MNFLSKIRYLTVLSSFVAVTSIPAIPAYADEILVRQAAYKVNVAGRQRMLSQRISMAACFATLSIDPAGNFEKLAAAHSEFSQVHDGLREGSSELQLTAETYKSVIETLDAVDAEWASYSSTAEAILSIQMASKGALDSMNQQGVSVLREMNIAVTTMASKYSADLVLLPEILAISIDFAGRERMLTQKMAKELCLVASGINADENLSNLRESHEQFNRTLRALQEGIPYMIVAAPTPEIEASLRNVQAVWEVPNAIFTEILAGGEIKRNEIEFISVEIDNVLSAMNDTVQLYQHVDGLVDF